MDEAPALNLRALFVPRTDQVYCVLCHSQSGFPVNSNRMFKLKIIS